MLKYACYVISEFTTFGNLNTSNQNSLILLPKKERKGPIAEELTENDPKFADCRSLVYDLTCSVPICCMLNGLVTPNTPSFSGFHW